MQKKTRNFEWVKKRNFGRRLSSIISDTSKPFDQVHACMPACLLKSDILMHTQEYEQKHGKEILGEKKKKHHYVTPRSVYFMQQT